MTESTKRATMASRNDYRKPRNKELRDLTWNLPYPLRVRDSGDRILWQNQAAEDFDSDAEWRDFPVSWQNNKAVLQIPRRPGGVDARERVAELEEEVDRLKRHQRKTARKKRQAEAAARQSEKAAQSLETKEETLQERVEKLEFENEQLRGELEKGGGEGKALGRLEKQAEKSEEHARRLEEEKKALEAKLTDLQEEFDRFKKETAEADEERRLEEQLALKVAELEKLESTLEEEQRVFDEQRQELEEKLAQQEEEFKSLRAGIESSEQGPDEDTSGRVKELEEELLDMKADLQLAERREKRLSEKLETLESLRSEHGQVLNNLREDLKESREHEKELRETLKLYSGLREDMEKTREESRALKARISILEETETDLRNQLEEAKSRPTPIPEQAGAEEETLSLSIKNQLDFLKKRLAKTERELDETRQALKEEKAQTQSSRDAERMAYQDALTGLPNRNMIDRYLSYAHQQAKMNGKSIGLFLIDVDGFRILNNTFGWERGDSIIKAVGERLNAMRGASHLVARHSQDQFLLLAADIEKGGGSQFVAEASKSLLEALAYPFEVDGEEVRLTGSVGVGLGPLEGDNSLALYEHAKRALDVAKSRGVSQFVQYDDKLKQTRLRESTYQKQMALALEKDEFHAVYQPVFQLDRGIVGLEILTRWNHRDLGELKPGEFLEPAISSGLIFQMTERLWPRAFKSFAKWSTMRKGLQLYINLSDKELLSPQLLERVTKLVKEAGVDPSTVLFEVRDQSRVRMSPNWWRILQDYNRAGFGLCLDDYGSDASLFGTLAYSGFKVAKVKVDESKGLKLTPAPQAAKGILYCAKGVQTKFDKKALTKAGFHLAQGYAVSRPIEAAEVDGLF